MGLRSTNFATEGLVGRQSRSRLISFYQKGGVETLRGGFYSVTALSGVNAEDNLRVPPRNQDGLEGL